VRKSSTSQARAGGRTRLLLALIAFATLGVLALPSAALAQGYFHLGTFGSSGSGVGQLATPYYACTDNDGYLYVTDTANSRVVKYTTDGAFVTSWGTLGNGGGAQLTNPRGICYVPTADLICVVDTNNNRVKEFTRAGSLVRTILAGGLSSPYGICWDGSNLQIADWSNKRMVSTPIDGSSTVNWGAAEFSVLGSSGPSGVAYDPSSGMYFVTDYNLGHVAAYDSSRTFQYYIGAGVFTVGNGPIGDAIDAQGNLLVSDYGQRVVFKFSPSGTQLLPTLGTAGSGNGFSGPIGITVDARGRIFVVDYNAACVQAWVYDVTPPVLTTDADGEWHSQSFNVHLSATDDWSGVDPTSFNWMPVVGGSGFTNSAVYHQDAPLDHSADGVHKTFAAVADRVGNWNSVPDYPIFRTKVDTRKPVTQLIGEVSWWVNTDVGLTFVGSDVGSGVAGTEYSTDHGTAWHPVPDNGQVIVSAEGTTEISYRSFDNCVDMPNVEDYKTTWTYIDKTKPTTHALNNVTVKKGAVATFKFDVLDNLATYCGMSLTIKKLSKIVKVINLGSRPSAAPLPHIQSKKATITLRAGTYTWFVTAYDDAGNFTKSLAKKLIVK
jgi:hypothetical protein